MAVKKEIEDELDSKSELELRNAGDMLLHARKKKKLSIEDVATETRIPQRHLISLETGDYSSLPGRTYAIGFAKSYAKTVGINDTSVANRLSDELEEQGQGVYQPETSSYSPANPTSVPPKALALAAAGMAAIVFVGFLIWRTLLLDSADMAENTANTAIETETVSEDVKATSPAPSPSGTVVLTAIDPVWIRIYDADGERLFEKVMTVGETYTVPNDANEPQIVTGRPDALTVTIDGQKVAPLGTGERTISDVGISATDLAARTTSDDEELGR